MRTYPVSVIGVGNMGGAIAQRLLARGWPVAVHDLLPDRVQACVSQGAVPLADVPDGAEWLSQQALTVVCVVDAAQVREVLWGGVRDGAWGGAWGGEGGPDPANTPTPDLSGRLAGGMAARWQAGHTVMLCPTIGPTDTEDLGRRLQQLGLSVMDAPMSGGPARAREGRMSLMMACADAVAQQHQALLAAMADPVFRVGTRLGDGARTKLMNNLLAGIHLAGAAEVLALASRLGLDPALTLQVMASSSGQSWIASDRMPRAFAGDLAPRAHMTLLQKDTRLALEAAAERGLDAPLGRLANAAFDAAVRDGLGAADDAALYQHRLGLLPTISE